MKKKSKKPLFDATFPLSRDGLSARDGGDTAGPNWAKTNWNFYPRNTKVLRQESQYHDILFHGWIPDKPFIGKDTIVTTFGSCFAGHIRHHMVKKGFNLTDNVVFRAGVNSTFAIRQLFEWVYENKFFYEQTC